MINKQRPIESGFDGTTTAMQALAGKDLHGMTAIVTGGYSGIGLEAVRVLAAAGAQVIVPARDPLKAERNLDGIAGVERGNLDLLDSASIDCFARNFLASGRALHLLINSAGIMATPLQRNGKGVEAQFATNHLGHFQLTARLWPALCEADGARVVSVSSLGHRLSPIHFDDPQFERRPYDKWAAYGQSKTANALFAVALDQRGKAHGVRAFSVHPGEILTDLVRYLDRDDLALIGALDDSGNIRPAKHYKRPEQGAATMLWCGVSPLLEGMGGLYCEDCEVAVLSQDDTKRSGVRAWAIDPEQAERLWALSAQLSGVTL
ncbi:NAD(P)-dependent dehydrogenase (short-subunit alcohol dehydrogenase family) [Pseudomonas sp. TE36184]|jgi:NAD(P)-dependent dehydrogenase (short-subunit alcohol dehydrogenase family)|uniref:oxidoreductase n=1 Tax=Pseudomonas TaxID=286 RepID=UPI0009A5158A|nr:MULTISPECIES: oxidoreductase [Pseudomonas]AQY66293.1 oxidoreductase [Pseudomonas veronii]NWD57704.1 SDR family NAD(P)-dependent oxidoreductase [Pseudomonas veronii]